MTEKQGEFIRLIRPDIDFNNLTEENRKDIQEIIDKYRFTFTRLRYDRVFEVSVNNKEFGCETRISQFFRKVLKNKEL